MSMFIITKFFTSPDVAGKLPFRSAPLDQY
jgi:hypothetical protein